MNIVITGASRGIGREAALLLSEMRENRILAISRSEHELKTLKSAAQNENVDIMPISINEAVKSPEKLLKMVAAHFNEVNILINNAGYIVKANFRDIKAEEEEEMIATNFTSPARLIRTLLPLMPPGSHVLNSGSMSGFQGSAKFSGLAVYGAAKAALASLTEALAIEFSDKGISFNCLSYGAVQTEMLEYAFPGFRAPLSASEMAGFVSWFALNGHKYFNGKVLPVAISNPS